MATPQWDLAHAETQRAQQRHREEDEAALRLAKRASRWRGVLPSEQSFTERSRRQRPGAVKTQELYLRDDLHCGIDACARCEALPHVRVFRPPRRLTRHNAEYVVPDATALLQLLELLEEPSFGATVRDVLVLETVLHEALRIAPSRDATRLKNFFKDESRRMVEPCCVVLFPNQHHVDTVVERAVVATTDTKLEPLASRDVRAFVNTVVWYKTHHVAASSRLAVLTPETDSLLSQQLREKVHAVDVMTCEAFVRKRFKNPTFLVELAENTREAVRWRDQQTLGESGSEFFVPHVVRAQLQHGVATGELIQGRLEVSTHNPNEAFVLVDKRVSGRTGLTKVFVSGRDHMNRGVHGDDVIVKLLPKSEWSAPQSDRVLVHYATEETVAVDHPKGDPTGEADQHEMVEMATATVVGIAQRSSQCIVATVLSTSIAPGDDVALAIPMDRRLPKVRLRSQRMDTLLDKRLKVIIDHWPLDSMYPSGHYTAVLGEYGSLPAELSAILVTHDIEDAPFCDAALACLPDQCDIDIATFQLHECSTAKRAEAPPMPLLDWQIPLNEISKRRDLRTTHRVFSVDPPGCQDIDDAMSVRTLANGNVELGVHIADVSFFVDHASPLDFEGRRRATTVYLVGQRLDMLPAVLSADLCSLHERVDRVAMSVLWELDAATLQVLENKTWFGRTLINSCASMTYDQAHRILQGMNADTAHGKRPVDRKGVAGGPVPLALQRELEGDLKMLTMISRTLAKARGEEGGLDLSRSETFSLNVSELGDGGGPTGVEIVMKESLEIHGTIAELMILANGYVAKKIVSAFPSNALLRRHPPPAGPRFEQLIRMAEAKAITIDATNNYTLQQSLVDAERSGKADAKTMALLKSLAVRVMSEAEYICASAAEATESQAQNQDVTSYAHYGLGLQYYTHFTSPIRRYADIIVHRQLLAALALDAKGQSRQILQGNNKRDVVSSSSGVTLPPSLVSSVLQDQEVNELDALVADADSKLLIQEEEEEEELLFPPSELVPLTQHLNRKNRNAKQASRSCEELFLALYFSTHTVRTVAIVTALKQNGFLVYVPTYDLRAPVYVRDRDGAVHMDPLLCGVRIVDSLPATGAFANTDCIRLLPQAHIELDADNEKLHVVVEAKHACTFSILDEIEVQISCDLSGSNARVPQLQLQLVGRVLSAKQKQKQLRAPRELTMTTTTTTKSPPVRPSRENSIPELQRIVQKRSAAEAAARQASPRTMGGGAGATGKSETVANVSASTKTMYELLLPENRSLISPPKKKKLLTSNSKPKAMPPSEGDKKTNANMRRVGAGRLVFGDYEPPRTQHYQQKLASYMGQRSDDVEDALMIQRLGGSGGASADELKQMERDALTRTAKLASERRHDRVNARKKTGR